MKTGKRISHPLLWGMVFLFVLGSLLAIRSRMQVTGLPASLQALYDRNAEARAAVRQYSAQCDAPPAIDLSGEVTPGETPLLLQWDTRWAFRRYNNDFMACTGCGPTCLSMAVIALTGDTGCDPWTVAQYAEAAGYAVAGSGTAWAFIPEGAMHYGLSARELSPGREAVISELEAGHLIICVVGPGDFTTEGHFLLLTGTEDGQILLHDPNSPKRSAQRWDYDRLAAQMLDLWAISP